MRAWQGPLVNPLGETDTAATVLGQGFPLQDCIIVVFYTLLYYSSNAIVAISLYFS